MNSPNIFTDMLDWTPAQHHAAACALGYRAALACDTVATFGQRHHPSGIAETERLAIAMATEAAHHAFESNPSLREQKVCDKCGVEYDDKRAALACPKGESPFHNFVSAVVSAPLSTSSPSLVQSE